MDVNPWNHHDHLCHKQIHHFQKFPPPFLFIINFECCKNTMAGQHWSSSCMVLEWPWGDTSKLREAPPDGRCWSSSCMTLVQLWGDTPHPRAKEKPQQDSWGSKFTFRIKPHSCQRCSEGSNKPCEPGPRDPTETETELCLSASCRARICSGLLQGQGLWV